MKKIITISRKAGSGGHTIGLLLAKKLFYKFYDEKIISNVSKELKLDEKLIEENNETMSDSLYIDLTTGFFPFNSSSKISYQKIKDTQYKIN